MMLFLALQVLFRYQIFRCFSFPVDRDYPPSGAVVHQLKAVYAAHEWLLVRGGVKRFVGRKNLSDMAVLVNLASSLAFEKSFLQKKRLAPLDVIFRRQYTRVYHACLRIFVRRDQPG